MYLISCRWPWTICIFEEEYSCFTSCGGRWLHCGKHLWWIFQMVQISNKIVMNPHMNLTPASISRSVKKVKETEEVFNHIPSYSSVLNFCLIVAWAYQELLSIKIVLYKHLEFKKCKASNGDKIKRKYNQLKIIMMFYPRYFLQNENNFKQISFQEDLKLTRPHNYFWWV